MIFINQNRRSEAWKRKVEEQSVGLYIARLKEIESLGQPDSDLGPSDWNVSKGQSDFVGVTSEGPFAKYYVVVEVEDLPTQGTNRELSLGWVGLTEAEFMRRVTGFWITFLRIDDSQPFKGAVDREFRFRDIDSLREFLDPMDISWYPAVQTFRMIEGESYWSPDWRCGDAPDEPRNNS